MIPPPPFERRGVRFEPPFKPKLELKSSFLLSPCAPNFIPSHLAKLFLFVDNIRHIIRAAGGRKHFYLVRSKLIGIRVLGEHSPPLTPMNIAN